MKMPNRRSMTLGLFVAAASFAMNCGTTQAPNTQVSDARITAELKSQLAKVQPSSLANVTINTTNGVVTLAGQVESDEVKRHAEEMAHGIKGVVSVNNELQIQAKSAEVR